MWWSSLVPILVSLDHELSRCLAGEEADEVQERVMGSGRVAVGDAPRLRSLLPDCPALRHSAIRPGAQVDPCCGTSGVSRGVHGRKWGDAARI